MPTVGEASLSDSERRALERFVRVLQGQLGDDLRSVWLYGSRARGEPPQPESDVDVLVVVDGDEDWDLMNSLLYRAAEAEGANPVFFSAHVYSADRLAQRREIRSFFIQEVDRDKIILAGEP